ncbi:hypothetical protein ACFFX0_32455 [Citricoccus parietis]|uniref:Uncharacterized protein n=1 Tax=Citricoccus parietis TaxID=592307 RepID=A0ABV5G9K4_9MICC
MGTSLVGATFHFGRSTSSSSGSTAPASATRSPRVSGNGIIRLRLIARVRLLAAPGRCPSWHWCRWHVVVLSLRRRP